MAIRAPPLLRSHEVRPLQEERVEVPHHAEPEDGRLGYRHAIDILQPLGYAETFVEVCVNIHMYRLFMKLFVYFFRCCIII